MPSKYVFADTQHSQELERLQAIEEVFDPASQKRILATGLTMGWRCLEVGVGAGSIMRWLAQVVGESGKITAVDLDTRFVAETDLSNVEVLEADIRDIPLESQSFDLIHTRFVLIHIPDFQVALSKILDLLKPGGWLVVEEPDFSVARAIVGDEAACQSVKRVNRAILQMFADRGIDYALGVKLPAIFQRLGLQQLSVENETPLSNGGSGLATVMKMSVAQLAENYIATGEATHQEIEKYCLFASDPNTWAVYHATVRITAQRGVTVTSYRPNSSGQTSNNATMPTSRSYHSYLIESLKDPQEAAAYLDAVLEDGDSEQLHLALRNVAEARIAALSDTQLASNEAAHQTLSQQSYLDLDTLLRRLDELGFKLSVTPKEPVA